MPENPWGAATKLSEKPSRNLAPSGPGTKWGVPTFGENPMGSPRAAPSTEVGGETPETAIDEMPPGLMYGNRADFFGNVIHGSEPTIRRWAEDLGYKDIRLVEQEAEPTLEREAERQFSKGGTPPLSAYGLPKEERKEPKWVVQAQDDRWYRLDPTSEGPIGPMVQNLAPLARRTGAFVLGSFGGPPGVAGLTYAQELGAARMAGVPMGEAAQQAALEGTMAGVTEGLFQAPGAARGAREILANRALQRTASGGGEAAMKGAAGRFPPKPGLPVPVTPEAPFPSGAEIRGILRPEELGLLKGRLPLPPAGPAALPPGPPAPPRLGGVEPRPALPAPRSGMPQAGIRGTPAYQRLVEATDPERMLAEARARAPAPRPEPGLPPRPEPERPYPEMPEWVKQRLLASQGPPGSIETGPKEVVRQARPAAIRMAERESSAAVEAGLTKESARLPAEDVSRIFKDLKPGEEVKIGYIRGGKSPSKTTGAKPGDLEWYTVKKWAPDPDGPWATIKRADGSLQDFRLVKRTKGKETIWRVESRGRSKTMGTGNWTEVQGPSFFARTEAEGLEKLGQIIGQRGPGQGITSVTKEGRKALESWAKARAKREAPTAWEREMAEAAEREVPRLERPEGVKGWKRGEFEISAYEGAEPIKAKKEGLLSGNWAIHREPGAKVWSLTHVGTGMRAGEYPTRDLAATAAKRLEGMADWSSKDPATYEAFKGSPEMMRRFRSIAEDPMGRDPVALEEAVKRLKAGRPLEAVEAEMEKRFLQEQKLPSPRQPATNATVFQMRREGIEGSHPVTIPHSSVVAIGRGEKMYLAEAMEEAARDAPRPIREAIREAIQERVTATQRPVEPAVPRRNIIELPAAGKRDPFATDVAARRQAEDYARRKAEQEAKKKGIGRREPVWKGVVGEGKAAEAPKEEPKVDYERLVREATKKRLELRAAEMERSAAARRPKPVRRDITGREEFKPPKGKNIEEEEAAERAVEAARQAEKWEEWVRARAKAEGKEISSLSGKLEPGYGEPTPRARRKAARKLRRSKRYQEYAQLLIEENEKEAPFWLAWGGPRARFIWAASKATRKPRQEFREFLARRYLRRAEKAEKKYFKLLRARKLPSFTRGDLMKELMDRGVPAYIVQQLVRQEGG